MEIIIGAGAFTLGLLVGLVMGEKKAFMDSLKMQQAERAQQAWQAFMEGFKK